MRNLDDDTKMACRKCKISLMPFPGPDGVDVLVHTRPWEDYDHEPDPVPSSSMPDRKLVCDFCGELGARWRYHGDNARSYGEMSDGQLQEMQQIDGVWAGCDGCDRFVRRGDVEGLVTRYAESVVPGRASKHAAELEELNPYWKDTGPIMLGAQRELWSAYLPTIRRRELIVQPVPQPPMKPAQMPKIRDRLVDFWNSPLAAKGILSDVSSAAYIMLPGYLFGDDDRFMVPIRHQQLDDGLLARHIERVTHGLDAGELYWVSRQFTHLAVTAAKKLPDVTIERDELPAVNGFVIWQTPIYEIELPDAVKVPIRAAAWTLIPGGVWVTVYIQPELTPNRLGPEVLRRELGWLMPWSAGGGASFGKHEIQGDGANLLLRSLVSTWLLMRQPGMATTTTEPVFPDIRKKYKRAGRPEPTVHVVNIRKTERATRPKGDGDEPTRQYTGAWTVGWETGGFWRTYWTGPGRAVRDRRFIEPYVARGDLPMKGEPTPKTTVKVLR